MRKFAQDMTLTEDTLRRALIRDELIRLSRKESIGFSLKEGGRSIGFVLIGKSKWESDHFGFRVDRVRFASFKNRVDTESRAILIHGSLRRTNSVLTIARTSLEDIRTIQAYESIGGILTDVLLTLRLDLKDKSFSPRIPDGIQIQPAITNSAHQVAELAKNAFVGTHFHRDPRLHADSCRKLYAKWVFSSLDSGDIMLVARKESDTVGFVASKLIRLGRNQSYGVIDLIAVRDSEKGRRIGESLLKESLRHLSKSAGSVYVGTQADNIPSLRLYLGVGFKPTIAESTHHIWGKTAHTLS